MSTATTRRTAVAILAVTAAAWGRAQSPSPLRIGFQKGSLNLALLKSYGLLEQRLPGTRVQWIEFPAGPQLLEALALGSVSFGATGDAPPVFAQAAGKDVVYVGAEPPKPDSSALLVRPDSPLTTLADLKSHPGTRIALQKGSSAHFLTVQAVKKAGLSWADIQPVYLAPAEARAAFERGAVDVWAVWDPYYAAAELTGELRTLSTSRGLTNNNTFYLASRALSRDTALLQTLFQALTDTDARARREPRDAVQRYAEFAGLPPATVQRMVERRGAAPVGPLTPELVSDQQLVADTFTALGLIPRSIRVADAIATPLKKA